MKKICFLFLVSIATYATAQNNDHVISMEGIGALKLGMTLSKVEEMMNKKLTITKHYLDKESYDNLDTAQAVYKNAPVQLEFKRSYFAPNKYHIRLIGIRTSSPLCKTATGIGVGTDMSRIITDYDDFHINMQPGYVNYYETEQGPGKSTITVFDDAASVRDGSDAFLIMFFLMNKKVVSFELKAELKDE